MFCPKCGTNIENQALFCPECGEKLETRREVQNVVPTRKTREIPSTVYKKAVVVTAVVVALFAAGKIAGTVEMPDKTEEKVLFSKPDSKTDKSLSEWGSDAIENIEEKVSQIRGCRISGCNEPVYKNGYCSYHYGYEKGSEIAEQAGEGIQKGLDSVKDIGEGLSDWFK